MKKGIKIALLSVLGLVIVAGVFMWMEFGALIKSANSCVKLDDGLYYMEYKGDDGFDGLMAKGGFEKADDMVGYIIEFLSKGHYKTEVETSKEPYGCSALTVKTPDGSVMMGRNFDFPSAIGVIMHCIPDKGYETITTFNVEFYQFGEEFKPEGFKNQYMCLAGLFVALDGINEKGLAIADLMAGDSIETHQRTSKPDLTTTAAIPYMLKNAANVNEALKLLEGIDMHSDIGTAHHYANHYLCEQKLNVGLTEGDDRYDRLCQRFDQTQGVMSEKQLTDAIATVSQPQRKGFLGTAWTMVMDLSHPSVTYYSLRHFNKPFHFALSRTK